MSMNGLIYTYALNKALDVDNKGKDYIDAFTPFAIEYLKDPKRGSKLESIQKGIKGKYKFIIPMHIIDLILERLRKDE